VFTSATTETFPEPAESYPCPETHFFMIVVIASGHRIFLFQVQLSISFLDGQYLFFLLGYNGNLILGFFAVF
jgi:hypothetical protein